MGESGMIIANIIAVLLTLCVFSRIAGDNPIFRLAQHLFVGVSLGYVLVVLYHQVLVPVVGRILRDGLSEPLVLLLRLVPFGLFLLLLPRAIGRQPVSWLANIPLGFLFGVSAGLTLIASLTGTLLPQILDTLRILDGSIADIIGRVFLLVGVLVTLSYFFFTAPRTGAVGGAMTLSAQAGRWVLLIAFGFFFAGSLLTYLTALNERFELLVRFLTGSL